MPVIPGIEVLRQRDFSDLYGLRVGLMTNPSAIDRDLTSTYRILTDTPGVNVVALFAPEHGFAGAIQEGAAITDRTDSRTGLPVYSLYGQSYRPTADALRDLDMMVCDIQDIGVRYYTFTWTVSHILEAAGQEGVRVMILDRPNPLGSAHIAGPSLEPGLTSFVGRSPVPVVHGLTLGEMALLFNATWNPTPAEVVVIKCEGWQRDMTWPQTGLPWVGPSPNMPRLSTLVQYPGACLIEGTTLSEGRGTALPFEVVGAPWLDAHSLADALNQHGWGGVRFRPVTFRPTASKWADEDCYGVQAHVTEPSLWRPIETWLGVIQTIHDLYPDDFSWLPPHTAAGNQKAVYHFDRLIGSSAYRQAIENSVSLQPLIASWKSACDAFRQQREPFLLYH